MKTMDRIVALCTCLLLLLLLGVLPGNIECSKNVNGTSTDSIPESNSSSILADAPNATDNNTELKSTVITQLQTNQTDNSSTTTNSPAGPILSSATPHRPKNPTSTRGKSTNPPTVAPARPTPNDTVKTTRQVVATTAVAPTTAPQGSKGGYIVLVVLVVVAIILVIVCYLKRNKSKKYSVDTSNKHEEAVIPLSNVEADAVFDATPEKELETFTAPETSATSQETTAPAPAPASEPVSDPEPKKGESAAGAEKAIGAETSGSKDPLTPEKELEKMEVVDINDGEPTISTKTSMESLEE